ncbi:hypothetical protein BYT27DRAFT_6483652 [Phlegmacium glaucopus]|nr:hypothetical protein BYT27DRAFT_6483652 [Phlegmacium glaucopus]
MEAIFDNHANLLNTRLQSSHDNSIIYAISTSQTLWGRKYTYLRDANPALGEAPTTVGTIDWKKKTFEIQGQRKSIKNIKRIPKGSSKGSRFWRWSDDREEYEIVYKKRMWKGLLSAKNNDAEATLSVPFRSQLFGKTKPMVLNLSRTALAKDEVFLILVLIYSQTKRRDRKKALRAYLVLIQPKPTSTSDSVLSLLDMRTRIIGTTKNS